MKNTNYIFLLNLVMVVMLTACNDDFLNRIPESDLNNETFWNSESSLEIYNNGIYNEAGYNHSYSFMQGFFSDTWNSGFRGMGWEDCMSDNGAPQNASLNEYQVIASGQYVVPDNPDRRGWNWGLLRRINFFLDNYDKTPIADEIKDQYAGEARMFRAWFYYDKVKHFGDVPWIDKPLTTESEELNAPRDSRVLVMDKVLEDLDYAIETLPNAWANEVRYDRWVALALKSRICLYEGTYRKYHNIGGDADQWLAEAAAAAEEIINDGPFSLYSTGDPSSDYNMLFRQLDLTKNPEAIAIRKYVNGVNGHRFNGYQRARQNGLTKDMVEDYLCIDGKPIQLSSEYLGDETLVNELANRDPRLTQTSLHPDDASLYLSAADQAAGDYPRFAGMSGGWLTSTGYTMIKYFDVPDFNKGYGQEENDALIIRLGEVMLNYAEAKAELNTITQADLDISINKLRERVGMPALSLDVEMDPKYSDLGISALLVEIRRERRVELAYEGFRYDDLKRWAQGEKLAEPVLGMRFEPETAALYPNAQVSTIEIDGKNYIDVYQNSTYGNRTFDPNKHYLFPIARSVLAQNPAIEQNPGW